MPLDSSAYVKAAVYGSLGVLALGLLTKIPYLGDPLACLIPFAYITIGALYGLFSRQNGYRLEVVSTMMYGALTAATASIFPVLIDQFFSGIIGFVICTPVVLIIAAIGTGFLGGIGGAAYAAVTE